MARTTTVEVNTDDFFFIIGALKQLKRLWDIQPLQDLDASEVTLDNSRYITENCDRLIAQMREAEAKAWGFTE